MQLRHAGHVLVPLAFLGAFVANAAPPELVSVSAAYDERRGRLVVFGGFSTASVFDDTWEWDGTTWRQVATSGPSPRFGSGMVYDAQRERVILFGGSRGAAGELGDTWEWNGTQWTQVASTGPSARNMPAMAYDRARGRTVLFGGIAGNTRLNDTWEWNGTSWERVLATGAAPAERSQAGIAYDEKRRVTVLFGGDHNGTISGLLRDMWTFDGQTWTEVTTTNRPTARDQAMAYDAALERIILFAGGTLGDQAEAWQWDGAEWHPSTAAGPNWRDFPRMVTDRAGGRVLMYGGLFSESPLNELWILSCDRWSLAPP